MALSREALADFLLFFFFFFFFFFFSFIVL
jgi:hypothetical protein